MNNQQLIQQATGLTHDDYCSMVFTEGLRWIDLHFGDVAILLKATEQSAEFWHWWQQQWAHRDSQFLSDTQLRGFDIPLPNTQRTQALRVYKVLHDAGNIHTYPDKRVCAALNKVIDNKHIIITPC